MKRPYRTSSGAARGAAVVELSLTLPVLLLLTFGVIDLGMMLRKANIMLEASRHGARSGGAYAAITAACPVDPPVAFEGACDVAPSLPSPPASPAQAAFKSACEYLGLAGYAPPDWQVIAETRRSADEGGSRFGGISVQVLPASGRLCFICWLGIFNEAVPESASFFPLQVRGC